MLPTHLSLPHHNGGEDSVIEGLDVHVGLVGFHNDHTLALGQAITLTVNRIHGKQGSRH